MRLLKSVCDTSQLGASLLIFFAVLISGCGGGGSGNFSWMFPLWVETDVVVTDIDGDGRADIITLAKLSTSMSHSEGRLVVRRQASQGVFAAPETYILGIYPWKLAVADINGDAFPDLVVSDVDGRAVWMLLQDANRRGQFLPAQQIATGSNIYEITVADLNSDGAPDVAFADCTRGVSQITLLYQNVSQRGAFLPNVNFSTTGTPCALAAGDLNGDGRADLFSSTYLAPSGYVTNSTLAFSLQQTSGVFDQATTLASLSGLNVDRLAIADYNGDGRNDLLAFFTPCCQGYDAKITVLLQGAQPGSFLAPVDTSLAGIQGIDDATFADLNGDGHLDVATVGFFPVGSPSSVQSRLNVFVQSGAGALALSGTYDLPIASSRIASGDIDGDGLNDLVVLGDSNQCLIFIQSHTAPGTFNTPYRPN